jgi:hypothetical protein
MFNKYKKIIVFTILILFTFMTLAPLASANDVNTRSASLLSAIRGLDTEIDVTKLSSDDIKVYGVFLSNYFKPGVTSLSNIDETFSQASTELGLSGSTWLEALNGLLKNEFANSRRDMGSVADFLENQKVSDIDLNNEAWAVAIKASFSVEPQAFLNMLESDDAVNRGRIFLDSLGNIWIEDKIFIPACLNPMLFGGKVSVNNKFIMGAFLPSGNGGDNIPYYTLVNPGHSLNILGITSSYRLLDSDKIILGGINSVKLNQPSSKLLIGLTGDLNKVSYNSKKLDKFVATVTQTSLVDMSSINDVQSFISLSELKSASSVDKIFNKEKLLQTSTGGFYSVVNYKYNKDTFIEGGSRLSEKLGNEGKASPITFFRDLFLFIDKDVRSVWGLDVRTDFHLVESFFSKSNAKIDDSYYSYFYDFDTFHLKNGLGLGTKPPMVAIYVSYILDFLDLQAVDGDVVQGKKFGEGLPLPVDSLPTSNTSGGVNWGDVLSETRSEGVKTSKELSLIEKTEGIIDFIHGFSTGSPDVISKFFKASLTGFVLSMHETLTKSELIDGVVVSSGVADAYVPSITMLTSLDLSVVPGVSALYDNFNLVVLTFIIVAFSIATMTWVRGSSLKTAVFKGIFSIAFFFLVLGLPGIYSNFTDNTVNRILSNKVMPWAMVQDQMYLDKEDTVTEDPDDYLEYLQTVEQLRSSEFKHSDPGVRIKWMSPKKENIFNLLFSKFDALGSSGSFQILRGLFASTFGGIEYTPDKNGIYVYRPYTSITTEARDMYEKLESGGFNNRLSEIRGNATYFNPTVQDYKFKYWGSSLDERMEELYAKEVINDLELVKALTPDYSYRYWHLDYEPLDSAIFNNSYLFDEGGFSYDDVDNNSVSYFASLTESPYYYFYNSLKSKYGDNFKYTIANKNSFIISNEETKLLNSSIKNLNGSIRDFADVEGLLTYVIPYLQSSNDRAIGWFDRYGYGVSTYNFGDSELSEDSDMYTEKIRKDVFRQHWNLYSSWVDHLTDHSFKKPIMTTSGQKVVLENALDPNAYLESGRAMIFSEADMLVKGLRERDLTDVETNILDFQNKSTERILNLAGYQGFSDEVLLSMASMILTEEFNRAFSSSSTTLYPVSMEMKNVDFTVLLKMALFKVTGTSPLQTGDSIRGVIIQEGFFTGLVLVAIELLGLWLIPLLLFLVTIFILLILISSSLDFAINGVEGALKKVAVYLSPLVALLVLRLGFAFIFSMQLGTGLNYLGDGASLDFGSPLLTVGFIFFLMSIYLVLIFRLFKYSRVVLIQSLGQVNPVLGDFAETVDRDSAGVLKSTANTAFRLPLKLAYSVSALALGSKFVGATSNWGKKGGGASSRPSSVGSETTKTRMTSSFSKKGAGMDRQSARSFEDLDNYFKSKNKKN